MRFQIVLDLDEKVIQAIETFLSIWKLSNRQNKLYTRKCTAATIINFFLNKYLKRNLEKNPEKLIKILNQKFINL